MVGGLFSNRGARRLARFPYVDAIHWYTSHEEQDGALSDSFVGQLFL